jgi:hypothetical protein
LPSFRVFPNSGSIAYSHASPHRITARHTVVVSIPESRRNSLPRLPFQLYTSIYANSVRYRTGKILTNLLFCSHTYDPPGPHTYA